MTNEETLVQIASMMEGLRDKIIANVRVLIENDVTKRLNALTIDCQPGDIMEYVEDEN